MAVEGPGAVIGKFASELESAMEVDGAEAAAPDQARAAVPARLMQNFGGCLLNFPEFPKILRNHEDQGVCIDFP